MPGSDTVWIFDGALAGHHVIISDSHHVVPGYRVTPPKPYTGVPVDSRMWGAKTGLTDVVSCDFVSRCGEPGGAETFSVVGPITMARVGR